MASDGASRSDDADVIRKSLERALQPVLMEPQRFSELVETLRAAPAAATPVELRDALNHLGHPILSASQALEIDNLLRSRGSTDYRVQYVLGVRVVDKWNLPPANAYWPDAGGAYWDERGAYSYYSSPLPSEAFLGESDAEALENALDLMLIVIKSGYKLKENYVDDQLVKFVDDIRIDREVPLQHWTDQDFGRFAAQRYGVRVKTSSSGDVEFDGDPRLVEKAKKAYDDVVRPVHFTVPGGVMLTETVLRKLATKYSVDMKNTSPSEFILRGAPMARAMLQVHLHQRIAPCAAPPRDPVADVLDEDLAPECDERTTPWQLHFTLDKHVLHLGEEAVVEAKQQLLSEIAQVMGLGGDTSRIRLTLVEGSVHAVALIAPAVGDVDTPKQLVDKFWRHLEAYCKSEQDAWLSSINKTCGVIDFPGDLDVHPLVEYCRTWVQKNWPLEPEHKIEEILVNEGLKQACAALRKFRAGMANVDVKAEKLTTKCEVGVHGTTPESLKLICKEGFDPNKRNGQQYGPGEYFSTETNIPYSIQWAKGKGSCQLIVTALLRATKLSSQCNGTMWVQNNDPACPDTMQCLPVLVVTFGDKSGKLQKVVPHDAPAASQPRQPMKASAIKLDDDGTLKSITVVIVPKGPGWEVQVDRASGQLDRDSFSSLKEAGEHMRAKWQNITRLESYQVGARAGTWICVPSASSALFVKKSFAGNVVWQYEFKEPDDGFSKGWHNYAMVDEQVKASVLVETLFQQWLLTNRSRDLANRIVKSGQYSYEVNFSDNTQQNKQTATIRNIRRVPAAEKCTCSKCRLVCTA